jgi:hypothetical protein
VSYAVIVQLIAATRTTTGLTVECALDVADYPTGKKSPMRRWRRCKSNGQTFMASGIIPSDRGTRPDDTIIYLQTLREHEQKQENNGKVPL